MLCLLGFFVSRLFSYELLGYQFTEVTEIHLSLGTQ